MSVIIAPTDTNAAPSRSAAAGTMDYYHSHNLVDPSEAGRERRWGIRVSLPPADPFGSLVGADWQQSHWYPTERERDQALVKMRTRHGYYRIGDEVSLVFEKIER